MTILSGIEFEEYGNRKANVDVSIECLTYNHVGYIRKTLDAFLMQKCDFIFQIVIFDDASNDGTSNIVREYAKKYPETIHAFIAKKNTYNLSNRIDIRAKWRTENLLGKYVAFCEGDDYWIYDQKLQKQYDFMEEHPEVSICVHNAIRFNESAGEVIPQIIDMDSGYEDDDEIINCNHGLVPTASYFYRRELVSYDMYFFKICPVGDQPLRAWLAYQGKVYYMDKVWSVRNYMHPESWNYDMSNHSEHKYDMQIKYAHYLIHMNSVTKNRFNEQFGIMFAYYCLGILCFFSDNNYTVKNLEKEANRLIGEFNCSWNLEIISAFLESRRKCVDYYEWLKTNIIKQGKKIYIYGAGIEAKKLAKEYERNGISFDKFVISNCTDRRDKLFEHLVVGISELEIDENKYYFELAMNSVNRIQVLKGYPNKLTAETISYKGE